MPKPAKPKTSPQSVKAFVELLKRTLGLSEDDPVMRKLRGAKTTGEAEKIVASSGVARTAQPSAADMDRATSDRSGGWGSAQAAAAARAGRYQDSSQRPYSGAGPTGGRAGSGAVSTTPVVSAPADPRLPRPRPSIGREGAGGVGSDYPVGGIKAYDAYKSAKSSGQPYTGPQTSYTPFTPNTPRTPSANQPYSGFPSASYRLTNQTGQSFTSDRYNNLNQPTPVPTQRVSVPPQQGYRSPVAYGNEGVMNRPPGVALRGVPTQGFSPTNASGQQTSYNPLSSATMPASSRTQPPGRSALQQAQGKYQAAIKDTDYGYGYGGYGTRDFSGSGYGDAGQLSSRIMSDLQRDYQITREQAAGAVGNLAHESDGFSSYQQHGTSGKYGGVGWAQWTNSGGYNRRDAFEAYAKEKNLDPRSYEANYGFMKHELDGRYSGTVSKLRGAKTVEEATKIFETNYEGAGVKNYTQRYNYANSAYSGYSPSSASNFDNNVAKLQEQLNANGASLAVDGIMGPKTQAAQKKFGTSYTPFTPNVAPGTRAVAPQAVPTSFSAKIASGLKSATGAIPGALRQAGAYANQAAAYASGGGNRGTVGTGAGGGSQSQYGGGFGGGGGYRGGGTYGGAGGGRISEGVGGAYRNR